MPDFVPGTTGAQERAAGEPAAEVAVGDELLVPLVEETARLDKRVVETGRVRVSTRTETVEQVLRESLRGEAVSVTRVTLDRTLAEGEALPQVRTEGNVTIVPVLEEVLVVEKRLVLREEVRIQRVASAEDVRVPVTLRRQRAEIEREAADDAADDAAAPPPPPAEP